MRWSNIERQLKRYKGKLRSTKRGREEHEAFKVRHEVIEAADSEAEQKPESSAPKDHQDG